MNPKRMALLLLGQARAAVAATAVVATVGVAACGGGTTAPNPDANGVWNGTYAFRGATTATINLVLVDQKMGELTGSARSTADGWRGFATLDLLGTRIGTAVQFIATDPTGGVMSFSGTLRGDTLSGMISGSGATYDGSAAAVSLRR